MGGRSKNKLSIYSRKNGIRKKLCTFGFDNIFVLYLRPNCDRWDCITRKTELNRLDPDQTNEHNVNGYRNEK